MTLGAIGDMAQAPQQKSPAAVSAGVPVAGGEGKTFQIREFKGLNTKSDRSGIDDQEFSWLENFFPIAPATLRTLASNGTALLTTAKTIITFLPFNVGATQYVIVFYSDGTADQVDMNGVVVAVSAVANTFYNGGDLPAAVQQASSGLVIVSTAQTNGYWAWDEVAGGTLYSPGTPAPDWLTGSTQFTVTGTTANGSPVITAVPSTAGVIAGMLINGPNIPVNSVVVSFVANTSITINGNATAPATSSFTVKWGIPTGIKGTAVEIFQSRVWVDNGAQKSFSAPANGANFSGAQGGGTITATDNFLRIKFTTSKQASSFLYSFADSSINVISNVQSTGSPIVTTFNNQNVDPQVGAPFPGTVHAFGRGLVFANPSGVYALYGGAAEKVSGPLDGLFAVADFTSTVPSGGVAIIYGVKVYVLLLRTTDYLGVARNMMFIWDGQKWFIGSQDLNLIYIESQEINSVLTLWGTDGKKLFRCFQTPSTLKKTIQTKLYEGDSYIIVKQMMRLFAIGKTNTGAAYQLTGTADMISDTGTNSAPIQLQGQSTQITWVNNSAQVIQWQNSLLQNINWVTVGLQIQGQDLKVSASLFGLTLISTSLDFTLQAVTATYRNQAPVGG
jgi:hypothetical protein